MGGNVFLLLNLLSASPLVSKTTLEIDSFHQWLDDVGVERKAEVVIEKFTGGGRGLAATDRIEPGEVVIRVPRIATLRLEGGQHDSDDDWAGVLAGMLVEEQGKGADSRFAPYLSGGLPKQAPTTPCRWTPSERLQLQNATLLAELTENEDWERRQDLANQVGVPGKGGFQTMLGLVCSRTLMGRDGSRQLVPLIDIANHSPQEAGGGYFKVDSDAVYLIAGNRGVQEGQAITMDYGARATDHFLLHYGFVPNRCASDSATVELDDTRKTSICWGDLRGRDGHPDPEVREACARLLVSYPTTLQEDVDELRSIPDEASYAYRSALLYRYAKKSLLTSASGTRRHNKVFLSAFA
jgi:hypothetical protein